MIDPADPEALAAALERKRRRALDREHRRKAARAYADKRLSNLTSISGGMRPAASPRFGSDSSKRKKKHKR